MRSPFPTQEPPTRQVKMISSELEHTKHVQAIYSIFPDPQWREKQELITMNKTTVLIESHLQADSSSLLFYIVKSQQNAY